MSDWRETFSALKADGNKEYLKLGAIFKMPMDERHGITPKDGQDDRAKFFIIVGFTDDGNIIGAIIINKGINRHDFTPELYMEHYPLQKSNYSDIFTKNSFACCTNIKEIKRDEVLIYASYKGCLINSDFDLIMEHLKDSGVITLKEKKKYGIIKS